MLCLREGVPFLLGDWWGEGQGLLRARTAQQVAPRPWTRAWEGRERVPSGNYCALSWGRGNAARWSVGMAT